MAQSLPHSLIPGASACIYSFSSYPVTCIVDVPSPVRFTSILTGMRRVSCSIWLITQMVLSDNHKLSSAFEAASRVSLSSVAKLSPKNNDSSLDRPLLSSEVPGPATG